MCLATAISGACGSAARVRRPCCTCASPTSIVTEGPDFFDYLDFVAAFASEDPAADFNADSMIDFFDYLDFVLAFDAGCE